MGGLRGKTVKGGPLKKSAGAHVGVAVPAASCMSRPPSCWAIGARGITWGQRAAWPPCLAFAGASALGTGQGLADRRGSRLGCGEDLAFLGAFVASRCVRLGVVGLQW